MNFPDVVSNRVTFVQLSKQDKGLLPILSTVIVLEY